MPPTKDRGGVSASFWWPFSGTAAGASETSVRHRRAAISGTWARWWLTGAGLFQFFADNRPGSRVYVMDLAARETSHRLIDVLILRDVFGDKTLHAVSGLGAAVDEEGHDVHLAQQGWPVQLRECP
jgi:hypothetical protein